MPRKITVLEFSYLTLLLFFISCGNIETDDRKAILECIIDNYTEVNRVSNSEYLSINENQFWSDSTSIIVLSIHKRVDEVYNGLIAEYNGIEIRLYRGSLDESSKIVEQNWIPTNLNWKKIKIGKTKRDDENPIPIGNHPPQIQLVYNTKSNCINEILLGNEKIITEIMLNCKNCN
ncbi:hypothetical protein [Luteirhabdus pelagi]|uniref:hypothetical protein n=1 Tax=Luteirhabdus pelagi TaxID=2792783 RepID=UPI0019396C7B|nr:hypothetical protein [Luteirhabdus pelagi]